uniref:ZP domain-containing protein n=1 Tax=Parascaris univalens TaxID=6257 RepID=A0A914ZJ23_PARUN
MRSRHEAFTATAAISSLLMLCSFIFSVAPSPVVDSLEHLLLQRYLTVECQRERMTVQLDFNRKRHTEMTEVLSEMIWRGRICIGDEKSGECCSQMIKKQGDQRHVISVGYSKCGIEKTFFETGFDFIVSIHFRDSSNRHEEFQAKCAIPFMESHVKAKIIASKQELKLSTLNFVGLNDKSAEMLSVRLGSNLHIAIEPTVEGMQERLHTYPLQCWTSSNFLESHVSNEFNRRFFIKDGCPVIKDNQELAVIEQNTGFGRFAEWTKVTLPISEHLFSSLSLNGSASEDSQHESVEIHCDVFICAGHQLLGFQNAPTCPRASFCTSGERRLPSWARGRPLSVSLTNPLRVLAANATEPTEEHASLNDHVLLQTNASPSRRSFDKDCARECSIAVDGGERRDEDCRSSEGIPVYVVVIIALISFGFGVAFVATLWMIHIKTDPLRKIRCAEHNSRSATLSVTHREPVVRSAANSNNLMTTALVERQRLVNTA